MSYSEYDTKRILIPIINDPNLSKKLIKWRANLSKSVKVEPNDK